MKVVEKFGNNFEKMATGREKPSQTYDEFWIWQDAPESIADKGPSLGKWLVFRHVSKIDEMWEKIRKLVESGELGATGAKVATMKKNLNAADPNHKVICVYTTKEDVDEVGLKLIQVVQNTIKYKTDEATLAGKYSWSEKGKVTCRTLEWNWGEPKFRD